MVLTIQLIGGVAVSRARSNRGFDDVLEEVFEGEKNQ